MKAPVLLTVIVLILFIHNGTAQTWQHFTDRSTKEIMKEFKSPPSEYGIILWWGWDGPMTDTVIRRDLDQIKSFGFKGVMIEAGYGMTATYLSPEWFELVKIAVDEAKKRGMIVWIEDEGKYPSGFAGGKFSKERPDLKMQGLVVTERIDLKNGESFIKKITPGTLSAVAVNTVNNNSIIIDLSSGELNFKAPDDNWRIIVTGHKFRSSVTRAVNNPTRGKDTTASLMDYLNPLATKQFLSWTHEQYKKYFGNEFGKTFLGFMGDEPDFAYTPWTPEMANEFRKRKGYDVTPYLASFFIPQLPDEIKRVKADYWDVWSDLFRDNFFKVQADWCSENKINYIVHLNHEDQLPGLARSSGDFFKNMRDVAVPGEDAIWAQIWPDHVADYPKLASSAAHLFGKTRSFTESFAAYTYRPTVPQAKWVIDYQLVRGINFVQIMFMSASTNKPPQAISPTPAPGAKPVASPRTLFFKSDTFPPVAAYFNRATYVLSQGRPASKIGVYVPTPSMWLGDNESNASMLSISQQLLENQHDFDFVDEQALSTLLTPGKGTLVNLSGQEYRAIIVPKISLLSLAALNKLKEFSTGGGKVIFMGKIPEMIYNKNIRLSEKPGNITWASVEPSGNITPEVFKMLPAPDFSLDKPCKSIKYLHRRLNDSELYFIFNESSDVQALNISLEGNGKAEEWDAFTGNVIPVKKASKAENIITMPLTLLPWETKFIVIKK